MHRVKVTVYLPEAQYLDIRDVAGLKHTSVSAEIAGMIDVRMMGLRPRLDAYHERVDEFAEDF